MNARHLTRRPIRARNTKWAAATARRLARSGLRMMAGHGGVMDRIDSICFAAPVFYYATRFFFTQP
jgi:cytidylyltransferase family protein